VGCPHAAQTPLDVPADASVVPILSMSSSLPLLTRLVRAAVRADARIAGFVRVVIFVVPAFAGNVLVPLAIGAVGAERGLQTGLLRRVGARDLVDRNIRLPFDRSRRGACGLRLRRRARRGAR